MNSRTALTRDSTARENTPFVMLDAKLLTESAAAATIVRLIEENKIQVLIVASPRLSG